jgi:hypothetical protein
MLLVDITANRLGYRLCPVALKIERSEDRTNTKRFEKHGFSVNVEFCSDKYMKTS